MQNIKEIQSICQEWILQGFPGAKILASNGCHFIAEAATSEVCIYEIRFAGKVGEFPADLLAKKDPKTAIVRAHLRRKEILHAVIHAVPEQGSKETPERFNFQFEPRTTKLHWAHIYPKEVPPELEVIDKKATIPKDDKRTLVVTHKAKGFGLIQVHVYGMRLADLSERLCVSILEHCNYPSVVPHSHSVHDGEVCLYDRKIDQWEDHSASRGPYTGSVKKLECVGCGGIFFGFEAEMRCRECQAVVGAAVIKTKNNLIAAAESFADSQDWAVTGEAMRTLLERWKEAGHGGDQEAALWEKFQGARQVFFDARALFFEARQGDQKIALDKKHRLILEAKSHAESCDWRGTSAAMRDLMERWKAAGSAGKENEDNLWRDFNAARQVFFERQREFFGN